jgi:hypothetical protein
MGSGPLEPSADMRLLANTLRQMYVALTLEGFTANEALVIIGHAITGQAK